MIDLTGYDFVDFGSSKGGSMRYARKVFGGRGLGIDRDAERIALSRAAGLEIVEADLRYPTAFQGRVSYCTLIHFLEHLPSRVEAEQCLRTACTVAKNFCIIRQPWFDSDADLAACGLKLFWSHWSNHPYLMASSELQELLGGFRREGLIADYRVLGSLPFLTSSRSQDLLPLDAERNQHGYDAEKHGPKPDKPLPAGVRRELMAVIAVNDDWSKKHLAATLQLMPPHDVLT